MWISWNEIEFAFCTNLCICIPRLIWQQDELLLFLPTARTSASTNQTQVLERCSVQWYALLTTPPPVNMLTNSYYFSPGQQHCTTASLPPRVVKLLDLTLQFQFQEKCSRNFEVNIQSKLLNCLTNKHTDKHWTFNY